MPIVHLDHKEEIMTYQSNHYLAVDRHAAYVTGFAKRGLPHTFN